MTPSSWITTWSGLVASEAIVLDVAAGKGRHTQFFASRGHRVTAIDRDVSVLVPSDTVEVIAADLEDGSLFPTLFNALQPGGILLYETFMQGNERFGKPDRPDFLLKDGELLELVRGRFSVTAYEARMISQPKMAMVQRIAARLL